MLEKNYVFMFKVNFKWIKILHFILMIKCILLYFYLSNGYNMTKCETWDLYNRYISFFNDEMLLTILEMNNFYFTW